MGFRVYDNWPQQTDREQTDREPTDRGTNSPPDQLTAEGANSACHAKNNRSYSVNLWKQKIIKKIVKLSKN